MIDLIEKNLLKEIADLHGIPEGAYNIRVNGKAEGRGQSANITIESKPDGTGIDIYVKPGTVNESVHITNLFYHSNIFLSIKNKKAERK